MNMKKQIKLMQGDNMLSLKLLPDNSVDSVVTDGPYGLKFMSKRWDYFVPSVEFWKEVYRVLKPGGHVLSFGGTRTYHRMVVNMEDAGFEIRDQIMWLYGSGFPKSLNIVKAYDKKVGNEREVVGTQNSADIRGNKLIVTAQGLTDIPRLDLDITKGSSQYEGWGTALKPANEPICLARKPLSEKTIVDNVIKWGTGGINVDGCRIGTEVRDNGSSLRDIRKGSLDAQISSKRERIERDDSIVEGRFPANILFDEIAAELLDNQSGISSSQKRTNFKKDNTIWQENNGDTETMSGGFSDKGGASRFFYVAKVSSKERSLGLPEELKSIHPTMKPINLMTYLCRMITPPGGIVLDPFMGSGSTGISACLEGFRFVGMELDEDYFKIAEARVNSFEEYRSLLKGTR